jgi:multiple sugar transport system ATP-binding protein
MAEIVLEKVVKNFAGLRAVDSVSLVIADGEFFTLLGPSGCGKTTTLRLIAGLEYPSAGQVSIGGRDVTRVPPAKRRIAMVFQNYALYPHMSIRQNINYPLLLRQVPPAEARERVERTAARLGIDRVLDRRPSEVSGGQQQRAAVARAMVQDPLVYLFDEPLSNLDARLRLESRRFLKGVLRGSGGTAVYVTHDQTEAMALSDRVGVMKEGRLEQVATPAELYGRPASVFVAGFVGSLPMNLVEGTVTDGVFGAGGFRAPLPPRLRPETGAAVTLGIRPEDVALAAGGELRGAVVDVEPLGSEEIVTVDAGGIELIVRIAGGTPPGLRENVGLHLPAERIHLFDRQGKRMSGRPGTAL